MNAFFLLLSLLIEFQFDKILRISFEKEIENGVEEKKLSVVCLFQNYKNYIVLNYRLKNLSSKILTKKGFEKKCL